MECAICGFTKKGDNSIFETENWIVNLANDQAYLGRSYVTLKRHCGDLAELKSEEWNELFTIIDKLEKSVRKAFGADLFNWTCLMNLAYQNDPPNPHIHWHFRPRYAHAVEFSGLTFTDPEFGKHYAREHERSFEVSKEVQQKIKEEIKKSILSSS